MDASSIIKEIQLKIMVSTLKFKKYIDWRTKMVNIIKSMIEIKIIKI